MHVKWPCGYLGVPVATNVASKEILLDTAALRVLLLNLILNPLTYSTNYDRNSLADELQVSI